MAQQPDPQSPDLAQVLANQRAITESLERVSGLVASTSGATGTTAAAATLPPGANLATHLRRSRFSAAVGAAVLTMLIAAAVLPNIDDDDGADETTALATGTATGTATGGVGGGIAGSTDTGSTTDAGGVAIDSSASGTVTAGGGTGAVSPTGAAAPAAAPGTPATGPNSVSGGATYQGVTEKAVKVGFIDLDSSDLAAICPRCGNGDAAKGGAVLGLIKAWTRDGLLPVHGRTIEPVFRRAQVLAAEQRRSSCVDMAQTVKPFLAVPIWMGPDVTECLGREFKMLTVEGQLGGDESLVERSPYLYFVGPTNERIYRNYVLWAHNSGIFKDQVLGLYSPGDAANQGLIDRTIRPMLKELGYKLAADVRAETGTGADVAVQRFRSAGVTTAILTVQIADFLYFQNQAESQGYRPKYPTVDFAVGFEDAVADITYLPAAMDRNLGFSPNWYDWAKRKPATPKNNDTASYCYKAYQDLVGPKDVYDNSAEIRYVSGACAVLEVVRKALELAGPNLTRDSFMQAMNQIKGFQTTRYPSVTFGPNRRSGADLWTTYEYHKERWPEINTYFGAVGGFHPFFDMR